MPEPTPLEEEYPGLAKALQCISSGQHPKIKAINIVPEATTLFFKDGGFRQINVIERNDPCYCGSGLKFKKCCSGKIADPPLFCHHCRKRIMVKKDKEDATTCRCYDPTPKNI